LGDYATDRQNAAIDFARVARVVDVTVSRRVAPVAPTPVFLLTPKLGWVWTSRERRERRERRECWLHFYLS
jgi:hypothetical protein